MKKGENNDFGIASVSIGAVALALSLSNQIVSIILGITAIVLSSKQSKNNWSSIGKKLGIASIIVSIILVLIAVALILKQPEILTQLQELQK